MIKLFSSILLGFWENPKLGSAISKWTISISRIVTCDADNLSDYQSKLTSTHTNCLIQLLKSGWLRAFRLNRGAHSTLSSKSVKRLFWSFSEFLVQLQTLGSLRSLVSGRRILQRYNLLSTTFFTAFDLKRKHFRYYLKHPTRWFSRSFPFRLRRKWGEL